MKFNSIAFKGTIVFLFCFLSFSSFSQTKNSGGNFIYVDKNGVIRTTKDKKEVAFFGVNYTVPFAYGYRSVKRTGISVEKAIDEDVYHMARLGLDAFRVHVWDWEITDSLGNLLENDHLRLFDYLLFKLKERNIKILITPIAFWGNGYPEKDEPTRSFSNVYGKGPSVVNEMAIKAQENYLRQFFTHINPYTKLSYKSDSDVIATEINNEPHHSGPKEKATEYINRLAAAIRSTGWTKPVFYNISESPAYADAVAKANVDGHSFQWYPTGLVANRTLQGNFLPHVDKYIIPFIDTISAFRNKARMVYEFDAGDVLQSNIYPAMARSFREAGFQWATQFAYDPMATAYANTEYQTHYVNLAFAPAKAISLMIASKAFHKLPRLKSYGNYPADSVFDVFRVSYKEQLSEMNSVNEFYYSNTTNTIPLNINKLQHIAGVGSSSVIKYKGVGAYFLDKVSEGIWRLEVMPDAIHIRDPFAKASPTKEVTRIIWQSQQITVALPDLGADFNIAAVNEGNKFSATSSANSFTVSPGTYLLTAKNKSLSSIKVNTDIGVIKVNEFVAPAQLYNNVFIVHQPISDVTSGLPFRFNAKIVGVDPTYTVTAEIRNSAGKWKTVQFKIEDAFNYSAEVSADMVTPGVINYRIIVKKDTGYVVFPGGHQGDPYAWDAYQNDSWETYVSASNAPVSLFNASLDKADLEIYNPSWRDNAITYTTADKPKVLIQKLRVDKPVLDANFGWQLYIGDKLKARQSEISELNQIVIRTGVTSGDKVKIRVAFISTEGSTFATEIQVTEPLHDITVPFSSLKNNATLLLPRPYPGFQPLHFKNSSTNGFNISNIEKLQVLIISDSLDQIVPKTLEVESVIIKKGF